MEPEAREDCEVWIVWRKDTGQDLVEECVKVLKPKFRAKHIRSRNFAKGHPEGSNLLWLTTIEEARAMKLRVKKEQSDQFNGILTFEADCVPLRTTWISDLTREWEEKVINVKVHQDEGDIRSNLAQQWPRLEAMGHVHQEGTDKEHINGNMIVRLDIFDRYANLRGSPGNIPWDMWHRNVFRKIGVDTNLIFQHYGRPTITVDELPHIRKNGVKPALFHGVKDGSARRHARTLLIDPIE